ncbi:MAG: dUTP diphosphatase [Candidatus Nomurabacteria bacterium]|nr:dUTP diphosphatase [Candidatus Nomurabacteria bacterium]
MELKFKKLVDTAVLPTKGSPDAAGFDLYAQRVMGDTGGDDAVLDISELGGKIDIFGQGARKIGTGVAAEIPPGYVGLIFARSGLATKRGICPANAVGVIDSDYRGEIIVALYNEFDDVGDIEYHERIAQLVIVPYLQCEAVEVDSLSETSRGAGGFGSTGTK